MGVEIGATGPRRCGAGPLDVCGSQTETLGLKNPHRDNARTLEGITSVSRRTTQGEPQGCDLAGSPGRVSLGLKLDGGGSRVFDGGMSVLEAQPAMDDDSFLSAGSFPRGRDRRKSARIPLTKPVRVGAPGGLPQSPVSAADLSVGGMFIDADRPVRVGARFSVQVPLASGSSVYIEEAEVVYNRQASSAPGFGVRFVLIDPATEAAIGQEVARLSPKTLPEMPNRPNSMVAEAPTLVPAAFGGDVAVHPAPHRESSLLDQALSLDASNPSDLGPADLSMRPAATMYARAGTQGWFWRHARRMGLLFSAVAAVTVLAATVVFLWSAPPLQRGPEDVEAGPIVPADTHRALMEDEPPAVELVPPPPAPKRRRARGSKRKPLPGFVPAERVKAEEVEEAEEADDVLDDVDMDIRVDVFSFRLSPRARVKRTMIYRSPERVVIDLVNQDPRLATPPSGQTGIRRFRVGRHPGFVRLVLDAAHPIEKASAEVDGRQLKVSVTYR